MTKRMPRADEDAADDTPPAPAAPAPTPMPMVMWIHDGPVCVTVLETPSHVPCGACQCAACRAHDPDRALNFF